MNNIWKDLGLEVGKIIADALKGGPTSGNYGHGGRPGERGGSTGGGGHGKLGIEKGASREDARAAVDKHREARAQGKQPAKPKGRDEGLTAKYAISHSQYGTIKDGLEMVGGDGRTTTDYKQALTEAVDETLDLAEQKKDQMLPLAQKDPFRFASAVENSISTRMVQKWGKDWRNAMWFDRNEKGRIISKFDQRAADQMTKTVVYQAQVIIGAR